MGGIALAIRKICSVKGEENPWQALADAIIIQAVKDYRNRARMMKRIRGRLKKNKEMTPSELDCQAQRLQQYEEKQDIDALIRKLTEDFTSENGERTPRPSDIKIIYRQINTY